MRGVGRACGCHGRPDAGPAVTVRSEPAIVEPLDGSPPAVRVEGVVKRFGSTMALAGVDLEVPEGSVFGLLGPNGAGKTTLVRILATLLDPDAGRAELLGVVGAGFGFRAVARELLDLVPLAGWAVKGAVAYGGTKAVGEAAVRYFETKG